MYVCMYGCMYVCMYVCMYACINLQLPTLISVQGEFAGKDKTGCVENAQHTSRFRSLLTLVKVCLLACLFG